MMLQGSSFRAAISEAPLAGYFLPLAEVGPTSFVCAHDHPEFGSGWLLFRAAARTLATSELSEVRSLLGEVSKACEGGLYAAGCVSYEASPAFDSAFEVLRAPGTELTCFHLYDRSPDFYKELEPIGGETAEGLRWTPEIDKSEYHELFAEIKKSLSEGVTYQVNLAFRMSAPRAGDSLHAFWNHLGESRPPLAAVFKRQPDAIISFSPELFFEWDEGQVRCKPMKGTAPLPGRAADLPKAMQRLKSGEKNQAENLMVVDMIRNDLGSCAAIGSVQVRELFHVEAVAAVLQMTSTVEARVEGDVADIFAHLFPCASITGAPKVSTMREIARLERSPRGIYTGAIGWIAPGRRARFSVAIRTVVDLRREARLGFSVGSGIVWDSGAADEWQECLIKSRVVGRAARPWALVETTRWSSAEGYHLLELHLDRLQESAALLGIPYDRSSVRAELEKVSRALDSPSRIRMLLSYRGALSVETVRLPRAPAILRARLALTPVCSGDPGFRFKTTRRQLYDRHASGGMETLLWNERGEITEFCKGNVLAVIDGKCVTPPLSCGLLAGTERAALLDSGTVAEALVTLEDLGRATAIYRTNSVFGRQPVRLI